MRGQRFSAMCTTALEQDRDALAREPLTQFVDGSAAIACQATLPGRAEGALRFAEARGKATP